MMLGGQQGGGEDDSQVALPHILQNTWAPCSMGNNEWGLLVVLVILKPDGSESTF